MSMDLDLLCPKLQLDGAVIPLNLEVVVSAGVFGAGNGVENSMVSQVPREPLDGTNREFFSSDFLLIFLLFYPVFNTDFAICFFFHLDKF